MSNWGGRRIQQLRKRLLPAGSVCYLCGAPIDTSLRNPHPQAGTLDHLIPRARGGTDHPSNLRPAHRSCNRAKSDKTHAPIVRRSGSLD